MQSAENFARIAGELEFTLSSVSRLSLNLDVILEEYVQKDVKIIVGMFGPADARNVLCRVN